MALGRGLKSGAVLGFGAVLLIGVPALAYLYSFQQKGGELEDQTLTLLGVSAERLESRVENARWTAENLASDPSYACEYLERQPLLSLARVGTETTPDCEHLEARHTLGPRASVARLSAGKRHMVIEVADSGDPGDGVQGEKTGGFTLGLELEPLLAELPLGDDFDQLLVLDDTGSVAASRRRPHGGPGLEIRSLADVRQSDKDGDQKTGTLDLKVLHQASSVQTVVIADTSYRLYCQPLDGRAGVAGGQNIEWTLCGLIDSDRVRREALALAPVGTIVLLTLFVACLLAWPFLKVLSMSSRERLKLADTYFLNISSGALLMLAMMLALLFEGYLALDTEARKSTGELAGDVASKLHQEISLMADRLEAYDQQLAKSWSWEQLAAAEETPGFTRILATGNHPFQVPATGGGTAYPWFSSMFWASPADGWQVVKATPGGINRPRVNVADRPYFTAVRDRELWTVDGRELYVDVLRSMTTGVLQTAVSRNSRIETPDHGPLAAVMIGQLLSATRPVLSLGHDFAVVDADGRIQLSTDPRLALDESLLDAVRDRQRLAAVLSHTGRATSADAPVAGDQFATTYLKRPHLLAIEPVPDIPWAVVAFFDRQILHTLLIESLCQAVMLCAFFALVFFVAVPLFNFLAGKFRGLHHAWAWPDRHKKALLGRLTLFFLGLFALQLASTIWFGPRSVLLLSLVIPGLALLALGLGHWRGASRQAEPTDKAFLRRGVWAFVVFWLVLAVLPATAFYRLAFNEQRLRLARLENLDFREQKTLREDALRRDLRGRAVPAQDLDAVIANTDLHLYRAELWQGRSPEEGEEGEKLRSQLDFLEPTLDRLMGYVPVYNSVVARLRFLGDTPDDDDGHNDGDKPDAGRWLKHRDLVWQEAHPETASRLPAWRRRSAGISLLVGLGLLVVLCVWGYWHTYHLFFGRVAFVERVHEPIRVSARDLATGELPGLAPGTHLIALLTSPRAPAAIVGDRKAYVVVDLLSDKLEDVRERMASEDRAVLCTRLTIALEDPAARASKLEILEWLVYDRQGTVVVLSMLDPFQLLFGRERRGSQPPAEPDSKTRASGSPAGGVSLSPQEARRWGRLVSHFVMVPVPLALPDQADDGKIDWLGPELRPLVQARHGPTWEKLVRKQGQSREALEGVLEAAEGYYWALWNACSDEEKLVLVQLVQETVLNPRHARTVRRLLLRGLLRRDSVLEPMNESFALFVSLFHRREDVRRWESSFEGMGWRNMRWVLMAMLAVLGLFLSATQREQLQGFLGFVPALAVGLPAILTLLAGRGDGGKAGSG